MDIKNKDQVPTAYGLVVVHKGKHWWVVNQCLMLNHTTDPFLQAKAAGEKKWADEVRCLTDGHVVLRPWLNRNKKNAAVPIGGGHLKI